MVDGLKFPEDYIDKFDRLDMLSDIRSMPKQLVEGYAAAKDIAFDDKFSNVILTGMGGSYIAGFVLSSLIKDSTTPIILNHDYHLPKTATKESLVIAISYSGNTEETISAFRDALRLGCKAVIISTGGKLEEVSNVYHIPLVRVKTGMQPRASLGYQLGALMKIFEAAGIMKGVSAEIKRTHEALKKDQFSLPAIKLSEKLVGKIPFVVSSELFYPVSYRWKTQFNENGKILAMANSFSEMNHNAINGFKNSLKQGKFHIVMLRAQDDSNRMNKRMELSRDLAQKRGLDVTEIGIKGNSLLTRLISAVMIGDLTAYYLALRYETDPTDVSDIEDFKEKMGPFISG